MARIQAHIPKDWQAEMDLNTIMEACKIRKDKTRMKAVKEMAKKKKMEKVDELSEMNEIAEGEKE